ncbi:hypothetical protein [Klebsiella sp. 2680]|uniref:hypothetical protein n=1 Tax=Klebsiella sp. 2680 TaxID=2018037 RepID=UPI00115859E8|nr:hypothetical protein [Klebsiella sp. 2680]
MSELAVIEIKPEQAPALYVANGLDAYLEQIKQAVNEVPDLSTKKGRDRIASLAAQVSRSKTAIEKPGREYLKHLKEQPKIVEAELRRFVTECDNLRDATRKPLTEWEAEQDRIKAEEEAKRAAEELAKKVEADHELALLMNDAFDREQAEKAAEAERRRIAHEEALKAQAAEQARREAEEKAAAELAAIKQREADAIAAKAQAELLAKQAEERAEQKRLEALAQAEREKQAAIEEERQKAVAAEAYRLAEEKRIVEETARRERDVKHRKAIGTDIVNALLANTSVNREQAIEVLTALKDGLIPHAKINY